MLCRSEWMTDKLYRILEVPDNGKVFLGLRPSSQEPVKRSNIYIQPAEITCFPGLFISLYKIVIIAQGKEAYWPGR